MEVIYEEGLNYPQGITCVKIKDKQMYLIWLWCGKKIEIYETLALNSKEDSTLDGKVTKYVSECIVPFINNGQVINISVEDRTAVYYIHSDNFSKYVFHCWAKIYLA